MQPSKSLVLYWIHSFWDPWWPLERPKPKTEGRLYIQNWSKKRATFSICSPAGIIKIEVTACDKWSLADKKATRMTRLILAWQTKNLFFGIFGICFPSFLPSFLSFYFISFCSVPFHFMSCHFIQRFQSIPLHSIALYTFNSIAFHCIPLHSIAFHCIPLHSIAFIHSLIYSFIHLFLSSSSKEFPPINHLTSVFLGYIPPVLGYTMYHDPT